VIGSLAKSITSLNSVATGDKKADLVLKNCSLISVYTREIIPKMQISIVGDRIAYVGTDAIHTTGSKTVVIDVKGNTIKKALELRNLSWWQHEKRSY